jgi:hypothetical protein
VSEPVTVTPALREARRATRYLRWYPRAWRDRYGEEFVAHLEAELEERPISVTRSLNIALHGVTTRFRFQASLRWMSGVALALVVVALVLGLLGTDHPNGGVPLTLNTDGSIGVPVKPTTVTNINIQFTDRTSKLIRVTGVALVGFRNYSVPELVRVQFDAKRQGKNVLLNPPSTVGAVAVLGHRILLGNGDSIVVSLRAPRDGRLYAVDGLRLTYERRGETHVTTVSLRQSPQLLCVAPHLPSVGEPSACNREFTTAWSLAQFYEPLNPVQPIAQREAFLSTNAAFDYVTGVGRRDPGLREVREWAATLFDERGSWRITRVTDSRSDITVLGEKHVLLFHFALRNRTSGARKTVCVANGGFDAGGGEEGPMLSACNS